MNKHPANQDTLKRAAFELQSGRLVAFPTETVYGLGADATNGQAVAKIFAAKGRPRFNPLITHVASLRAAQNLARFNEPALYLANTFWPGPLTLVLPKKADCPVSDLVTAGLETIALRIPKHDVALQLLTEADCPVAAPSANVSGHVSATQASHVSADFISSNFMLLDAGTTKLGLESTIVLVTEGNCTLLRPGAITTNTLQDILGQEIRHHTTTPPDHQQPNSPGQLTRHYAPKAKLRLNATSAEPHEAVLAFGPHALQSPQPIYNLSLKSDLHEAAANLFTGLRYLDSQNIVYIAAMPIPNIGLGEAINDRLVRAAAKK